MATKGTFKLVLALGAAIVISTIYNGYQQLEKEEKKIKYEAQQRVLLINKFKENKDKIINTIDDRIAKGDYRNALELIEQWQDIGDKDIKIAFKRARTAFVVAELRMVPKEQYERNLSLYTELSNLNPESEQYNQKIEFYTAAAEQHRIKIEAADKRRKLIESGFSKWDGSHLALERYVISSMNDPDSYDHVETSYSDKGNFILVVTKFRGKNAFGGIVIDSISANAHLDGDLIGIIN